MKGLLVTGPDSTLRDVFAVAQQAYPGRTVVMHAIPSSDYYHFDLSGLAQYPAEGWDICIAVNEFYINDVRRALRDQVSKRGYRGSSAVSPHARVDASATIGENVVVHPGCAIGAGSTIGHHAVLRPNVVLAEDVSVGCFVTIEGNVAIREHSTVGDFTTICANSSLARMTRVGAHCYLNLSQQYSGVIATGTFYSPSFQNPVQVLGS